ncbi:MAG: hypothetical protein PHV23_03685 [Candidatus Gracilibacteria bacterium]|nr:hypothetical protein [Candidatus Gracilibacteria bacterium]
MKKKIISGIVLCILLLNPFSFTFAKSKVIYEKSEGLAKQFINNSLNDENWKGKNPYINGDGKYFYTDDDKYASYIEFKISCDNNIDCGFILVNSDSNDVSVPISSTSGIGPGELLTIQNNEIRKNNGLKNNNKNNKLYYFSPFDQYSEDLETGNILSIQPEEDINNIIKDDNNLTTGDKQNKIQNNKTELKQKILNLKEKAKEYKKSEDFKQKKNEIQNQIMKIPKDEFVINNLNIANAGEIVGVMDYLPPSYASNTFVPGLSYSGCSGKVPCYEQFPTTYNGQTCLVGCVPTAYAMIYGYYDRKGQFPNLISGTVPTVNNTTIQNLAIDLGKNYMGTYCNGNIGVTSTSNGTLSIQYAKNKGYINSTATAIGSTNLNILFNSIKSEINSGRPLVGGDGNHAMVIYGYYMTADSSIKIIRVNLGLGNSYVLGSASGLYYRTTAIDYNLNSIYYESPARSLNSIVKILISN